MQNQQKIQDIQKEVNERFAAWQKSSKFPKALYSKDKHPFFTVSELIKESFRFFTHQHLKLSLEDFESLYNISYGDYNLREISNILYMVQNLTANDLNLSSDSYFKLQTEINKMAIEWQKIVGPKNKELQEEATQKIIELQGEDAKLMNEKINQELKEEKSRVIEMPIAQA